MQNAYNNLTMSLGSLLKFIKMWVVRIVFPEKDLMLSERRRKIEEAPCPGRETIYCLSHVNQIQSLKKGIKNIS